MKSVLFLLLAVLLTNVTGCASKSHEGETSEEHDKHKQIKFKDASTGSFKY